MLSSGANVIIWDKMLSFGANVKIVSSGGNVIIWCYHVMLSAGMITHPFFYFSWKLHSLVPEKFHLTVGFLEVCPWPGESHVPPQGVPEKFHLTVGFLEVCPWLGESYVPPQGVPEKFHLTVGFLEVCPWPGESHVPSQGVPEKFISQSAS